MDLQSILPAEAFKTEKNSGDYIGEDGLLYCGVCRTKKQTRLPASDITQGKELIVPCICKCKVEEKHWKKERNATCIQMNGDFARQKFRALQQLW